MELLLTLLVITGNVCADIISRMLTLQYHHEGDYWAKLDLSVAVYFNTSYYSKFSYKMAWFNRTTKAVNFESTLRRDLGMDIRLKIQAYKFLSNEYRYFPVTLDLNACEELRKNTFGIKTMVKKWSNFTDCPFKKGSYYMHNAVQDFSAFPPLIPAGKYKIQEVYYMKTGNLFEVHSYYTVVDIITKWEN